MSEFSEYILSGDSSLLSSCTSVDDRIQKSSPGKAIFYFVHHNQQSEEKLLGFLKQYTPDLLVINRPVKVNVPCLVAKEDCWVDLQAKFCDKFFPIPKKPKLLAITGTNGKTTTADLVIQLASLADKKAISIGTLGVRDISGEIEDFGLTTPSLIQLRRILYQHCAECDLVSMEVSSHALDQERVRGLVFHAAGWTSFTQDHLDYHKTMENYFQAKEKIIEYLRLDGKIYFPSTQVELIKKIRKKSLCVTLGQLDEELRLKLPSFFKTKFNLDNLSVALALVSDAGIDTSIINIKDLKPTPGRFYIQEWKNRAVIVDFAHTPDALENLLSAVKEIYPTHKLKVLFGCGGDRDRTKRPLMGASVEKYTQDIILTSDNPRTEDPEQIIDDIAIGISNKSVKKIVDRPLALKNELEQLGEYEVLVVAGKGHENYIIKGTTKIHYSDIETVDEFLKRNKDD